MARIDGFVSGNILVVAFEGWNDAGDAASNAVQMLREQLDLAPVAEVEPEDYFDFQFSRPSIRTDDDGNRVLDWPGVTVYSPLDEGHVHLVLGTEPSRGWKTFSSEIVDAALAADIAGIVFLGAMLADVPHTRPIAVNASSDNAELRQRIGLPRAHYEGPVGILSVLAVAAERAGIPTMAIWASVPHYVHNAPSPKATLALLEQLEGFVGIEIDRGSLEEESEAWVTGIDALADDDEEMAAYITQLERARDTVDAPEASGDAIAEEFERYLRRRDRRAGEGDRPPGA